METRLRAGELRRVQGNRVDVPTGVAGDLGVDHRLQAGAIQEPRELWPSGDHGDHGGVADGAREGEVAETVAVDVADALRRPADPGRVGEVDGDFGRERDVLDSVDRDRAEQEVRPRLADHHQVVGAVAVHIAQPDRAAQPLSGGAALERGGVADRGRLIQYANAGRVGRHASLRQRRRRAIAERLDLEPVRAAAHVERRAGGRQRPAEIDRSGIAERLGHQKRGVAFGDLDRIGDQDAGGRREQRLDRVQIQRARARRAVDADEAHRIEPAAVEVIGADRQRRLGVERDLDRVGLVDGGDDQAVATALGAYRSVDAARHEKALKVGHEIVDREIVGGRGRRQQECRGDAVDGQRE